MEIIHSNRIRIQVAKIGKFGLCTNNLCYNPLALIRINLFLDRIVEEPLYVLEPMSKGLRASVVVVLGVSGIFPPS